MTDRPKHYTTCQQCDEKVETHKWAQIKAHAAGWYFMRDGRSFCPKHRPPWAPPWPKP